MSRDLGDILKIECPVSQKVEHVTETPTLNVHE